MKIDKCVILALAIFALIIVGEACTVNTGIHNYGSSAEWKDGCVEYSVSSSGTEKYDVILMDNHGYVSTDQLKIYIDDDYNANFNKANEILPMTHQDQQYMYKELSAALRHRNFEDYSECNDDGLSSYLKVTMNQKGFGLFVGTFELPSLVYDGTENCLLLRWVKNGGNLYWFGSEIGAFEKTSDGIKRIDNNQMLFFGANDCINRENNTGVQNTNDYTKMLSLRNSLLRYGLNVDKVNTTAKFSTGFSNNGYSTIGMVGLGKGSVNIFSESYSMYMYDDMSQVIAAKITPYTEFTCHNTGDVKGTLNGRIEVKDNSDPHLYIYIGGHCTVYGRSY